MFVQSKSFDRTCYEVGKLIEVNYMNSYLSIKIKVLSLLAILMVIYHHSYNLKERSPGAINWDFNGFFQVFFNSGITVMAVEFFFAVSGYLYFYNFTPSWANFLDKYKKRFFSLAVPFLLWSLWGIIFYFVMQSLPFTDRYFADDLLVRNYTLGDFIKTLLIEPLAYPLWFLPELFKYVLLSPLIYFYIKKFSHYSVLPFALCWFFGVKMMIFREEGILFFLLGSLLAIKGIDLNMRARSVFIYATAVMWVAMAVAQTYFAYSWWDFSPYLDKLCVALGVASIWQLYDIIVEGKTVSQPILNLSSYTFFLFLSHEPVLHIYKKLLFLILGSSSSGSLLIYITAPLLTIATGLAAARLLELYTGPFYKVITGNRKVKLNQRSC